MIYQLVFLLTMGFIHIGFYPVTSSLTGRVYKGFAAIRGQFPYQVRIEMNFTYAQSHCSGVLIGECWVLTAAHCVQEHENGIVVLYYGSVRSSYHRGVLSRRVDRVYIHEGYNDINSENDIALLSTARVKYTKFIGAVILPDQLDAINADPYVGELAFISGWGVKKNGGPGAKHLHYALLNVIGHRECKTFFPMPDDIHPNELCAKDEIASPCIGDSGGPLVTAHRKILIGVLSGVKGNCESGSPTVYTRVSSYRDWIINITGI